MHTENIRIAVLMSKTDTLEGYVIHEASEVLERI